MNKKKWNKIFLTIVIVIITILIGSLMYFWLMKNKQKDMSNNSVENVITEMAVVSYKGTFRTKGVVVRSEKDSLTVMPIPSNEENRIEENFQYEGENNLNLKQGQEVLVTFHYLESELNDLKYVAIIEKVELIKEESSIEIPRDIIVKAYSSKEKITVKVDKEKSDNSKVAFTIKDNNEFKYNYATMEYDIRRYNEPPTKTEVIHENNTTYIAGYDPWPGITKIGDISTKSNYSISESGEINIEIDWAKIYGKLEEGKYKFSFTTVSQPRESLFNPNVIDYPYDGVNIQIYFNVNKEKQVEYSEIEVF